jgi:hypothetical protein
MAEALLATDEELEAFRNVLLSASDQLLEERNAAAAAGQPDKVKAAETEFDRIEVVLATVQGVINRKEALRIDAVAERLQDSIRAQKAAGLSAAVDTLADIVKRLKASRGFSDVGRDQPAIAGELRAKPGPHAAVVTQLIAGAKAAGLDPMLVLTIVAIESDFRPAATSPLSSAGGLFQFLDATWTSEGGPKIGAGGKGNGFAASAPVDLQVKIGCAFVAKTIKSLRTKLKREPSVVAVYMAHQQGLGGALKILQADPGDLIESVIGVDAAHNNRFDGFTVAQTIAKFNTMVRTNEDEARILVTSDGGGTFAGEGGGTTSGGFAARAVHAALSEMEKFARRGGNVVRETQDPLSARVLEYFRFVGRSDITDPSAEAWSAAFISFVMSKAGATATTFPFSAGHSRYILSALANRIANRDNASLVYFDRHEMAPRVGDLVGFSRQASVQNRADLERLLPDTFFKSHTDLVVDVSPGKIKTIGGNLSQSIMPTTIMVDADGKMDRNDKHFFVLRLNI